eukprot:TRINITY_DN51328_c0_g1_i2.p1 TRINITY_DN51328_c0_g1~~TRINITY_DN51328_c0_g1_i2.p1  ORF type:complete len:344 (-),score=22.24 TRINITY_DN51328_c0_g1_i2:344-1351(-)
MEQTFYIQIASTRLYSILFLTICLEQTSRQTRVGNSSFPLQLLQQMRVLQILDINVQGILLVFYFQLFLQSQGWRLVLRKYIKEITNKLFCFSWTVLGVEGNINGLPSIKLVKSDGVKLVPGAEISLDYGSRSSEQFLFVYGFVNEDNPYQELYEEVMIPVQLQQFLSDPNIHERLLLLQKMGLKPQIFLQQMNETAGAKEQKYELPDQVVQILEVMVAPVQEVLAQLELESSEDISPPTQQQLYIDNKFRLMAILTTYVELLKQQLQVMESDSEGTGRLEVDEKILEANTEIPYWKKCAIKYRMSQKRVLRQHFAAADTVLDQLMQDIMAMQKR